MADFIPLARAAMLAHRRLFPGERVRDTKRLDLLAVALSARIALYQQENEKAVPRRLKEEEVAAGRFVRGATRLEFANRPPLRFLMVSQGEFERSLAGLAEQALLGSIWKCRRPTPGYSSVKDA
jgi:hypothetical protein